MFISMLRMARNAALFGALLSWACAACADLGGAACTADVPEDLLRAASDALGNGVAPTLKVTGLPPALLCELANDLFATPESITVHEYVRSLARD